MRVHPSRYPLVSLFLCLDSRPKTSPYTVSPLWSAFQEERRQNPRSEIQFSTASPKTQESGILFPPFPLSLFLVVVSRTLDATARMERRKGTRRWVEREREGDGGQRIKNGKLLPGDPLFRPGLALAPWRPGVPVKLVPVILVPVITAKGHWRTRYPRTRYYR